MSDDSVDPDLVEHFDRLREAQAPDLWRRIVVSSQPESMPNPPSQMTFQSSPKIKAKASSRVRIASAAMVLAVVAVGVGAIYGLQDPTRIDLRGDAPATTSAQRNASESSTGEPTESLTGSDEGCVSSELATSLSQGMPDFDYEPAKSPADLVEQSPLIVRGQLIEATEMDGGSVLLVKTRDQTGPQAGVAPWGVTLWTPATIAPEGILGESFVAFLTGDTVPLPRGRETPWVTHIEGFWVGCNEAGPAASVIAEPAADGWDDIKQGGVSLDELWQAAFFPTGPISTPLGEPTHTVSGADVFDLRLVEGERFRLSLPEGVAEGALLLQVPGVPGATIDGPDLDIEIRYGFCSSTFLSGANELGSEVEQIGLAGFRVCRPGELLEMIVGVAFDEDLPDPDTFDLRPIVPGGPYGELLNEFRPELSACGSCNPDGPAISTRDNVVVNRTGETKFTAVSLDTLAEVWTFDTEGLGTQMHATGRDAVYFSDPAAPFVRVHLATGIELWRKDFTSEHEYSVRRTAQWSILIKTSFSAEGDSRAPILRRLDETTGDLQWVAEGREWGDWQPGPIGNFNSALILMDAFDDPTDPGSRPGSALFAFDKETGERRWATKLDVSGDPVGSGRVLTMVFESGEGALIAQTVDGQILRVDPVTGEVIWQARIGAIAVDGTEYDEAGKLSISVQTPSGQQLLNPETGAISR